MMKTDRWCGLLLAGLLAAAGAARGAEPAGEWPWYRGPSWSGISRETGLLKTWPAAGPRVIWKAPLGEGYSGISVAGGRVYTMYARGDDEFVACLDAATGKQIWRVRTDANRFDDQGSGPRSTPTVDGDVVFALGARAVLHALKAETGETVWMKDLKVEFGAKVPRWGASTSPLVEGDLLLLDVGGRPGNSIVALDKRSGRVRWTSHTDKAGYSTPLAITVRGVRQILFFTGSSLISVSPEDGEVLWSVPWKTSWDVNAAMPVFVPPDKVFISSSYDVGAALFRVKNDDGEVAVEEIWKSRVMKNHFNSSIHYGGHLYGFDNGTLKCIDANTGEEKWGQRGFAKGSLLLADGHLIVLSEHGLLALAEATPDGYREKGRVQILEGRTWTMPSLARGKLFLRNREEMVALDVAG